VADNDKSVFISYARDDRPFVQEVAAGLRARGIEANVERDSVHSGERMADELKAGLESSNVVVVFFGNSVPSPWMNFEIGAAIGSSKQLVPVLLDVSGVSRAPTAVSSFDGIDAHDLKPDEVAERIADVVGSN
jgi:hypothetical protein